MPTRRQRQTAKSPRRYLLWDTFPDARAAGAVNGTRAWPGPGVRTVVDTENKLSIANGVLSFAGGKASPSYGDPGLYFSAPVQRVAGRVGICKLALLAADKFFRVGFFATLPLSGAPNDAILLFDNLGMINVRGSASSPDVGVYTATAYTVAFSLRAVGAYFFIRGGAFANWTLLLQSSEHNAALLYFASCNYNSSITADDVRIAAVLWPPPPLAYDTFTRADGALGTSEYTGPDGQATPVRTWTGATWAIASNKAVNTPTTATTGGPLNDGELLTDPGLEANYTAGLCDSLLVEVGSITLVQSADVHGGAKAQGFTATGIGDRIRFAFPTVTAGQWLMASIWAKRLAGTSDTTLFNISTGGGVSLWSKPIVSAVYTQLIYTFLVDHPDVYFRPARPNNGPFDEIVFDDCSLKVLNLSSLVSSCGDLGTPDVLASADLVITADTQAGLVTNLDSAASPANFLLAYHDGTNAKLDKCVAGTYTNLISAAATYSAGATLRLITYTSGANLMADLFYNNVKIGTTQSVGDAGIKSNTICGLFSTYSLNTVDNWTCFARGSEGQYAALDSM